MKDVALRQGLEYDRNILAATLEEMIEVTGGWPEKAVRGARVLLKVNMLSAKAPERAITTHPEVVAAMTMLLHDRGCSVAVGDSPGGAVGGIERYWRNCGFDRLVENPGVELVSFERAGSVELQSGGRVYRIAKPVFEYDVLINMCKFKTHMYCRLTNAVKNSFGVIPGIGKAMIHSHAVRPRTLSACIADIYKLVPFDMVVMDAILSMDGRGPGTDGHPRMDGILGVARDGVLLDMVMSKIAGLRPEELYTTREALKRGLGKPFEEITVDGTAVLPDFDIPATWFYDFVPGFAGTLARAFVKTVPAAGGKCTGCGFCARSCPVGAIEIRDGRARMNRRKCIVCLCCHELCPENAITVRNPLKRRGRREAAPGVDK